MLETTGASLKIWFKPILPHSLISADVIIKTFICGIFCAAVTNLYTGGNHLILVAQYFIKHVALHRPANSVDLALAVRHCKMIPCYLHIVIFL